MTPNLPKMVMCNMNNPIPRPPALPIGPQGPRFGPPVPPKLPGMAAKSHVSRNASIKSKNSTSSQGFRLVETGYQNNDDASSIYSIYKQKIDSMFESDSSSTKNSVQAKIEKMFSDVAKDGGVPVSDIGVHTFSVDYLGSVPLQEKVTSLAGLQGPLRDLYFAYKKTTKTKQALTGRLEISAHGLKVRYQGEKGDLEQLNSFPTIAVWSAVKFVIHAGPKTTYAFLPLITDPDNMEKQSLFRTLSESEKKYITSEAHSPLFAVVMRKIGVHKQLECHGFVCQTSEDAIVIAATLYKSLVAHMKAKERKPRNRNGVTTCLSVASSTYDKPNGSIPVRPPRKKRSSTSSVISESEALNVSDTQPLLNSASRPKKSIKTKRAPKAPEKKNEDLDAITPYEEPMKASEAQGNGQEPSGANGGQNPASNKLKTEEVQEIKPKTFTDKINTCLSREQKQLAAEIKQVMSEGGSKGLKKVQSVRKNEDTIRKKENSGDILTKVTIPRSGSFLNAGGLTRYKNKVSRNNDQASGGSPLGFKEIFNELSLQEGLHSLDDILGVIIDPEGMSFNDLKPIYKEFLLKLSVTLTKDELYQRSKSIMRRQKKKLLRRNSSVNAKKRHHILVGGKFRRLKHIFQRNLKATMSKKLTAAPVRDAAEVPAQIDSKLPESSISTSSYDTRQFRTKEELSATKKQSYRKKHGHRRDRTSTSEESDFFSLKRGKARSQGFALAHNQNRNSSSGYVSCSECSYDSDTCTCVSADKCYCSLGQKNFPKRPRCPACKAQGTCYCQFDSTLTFCECDTDSCADSNKCYCQSAAKNATVFEQLKQRGLARDEHRKLCKKNSNTKSTKSVEYILNPSETYYEKIRGRSQYGRLATQIVSPLGRDGVAVDYELFSIAKENLRDYKNLQDGAVCPGGFCERSGGFGSCKPTSVGPYGSTRNRGFYGRRLQSAAISSGEALSVKKSAEIAALFADVKLSQTTDITCLAPKNFDLDSAVASKNTYNKLCSQPKPLKLSKTCPGDGKPIYGQPNAVRGGATGARNAKNNMYSAKNGLYTIQSQSDESRRSSMSEGRKMGDSREYFELQTSFELQKNMKNVSSNIENSLGYLP